MKAVISGRRYDTDKSILIGEASNGRDGGDFHYWSAGLYKTPRSGAYFLAGGGGPMTAWSRSTGQNSWTGGEGIREMDADEAFEWAQQYLDADAVEAHFADRIVDA